MRSPALRILAVITVGGLNLLAGCSLSDRHQLESSLRQSESSIRRLERELSSARQQLHDQENELQALKEEAGGPGMHTASSSRPLETEVAWGAVDRLRIHQLASGILSESDGRLTLNLTIQPLDEDGEVVKVSGELLIRVQQPGEPELLSERTLTPLESRDAWASGIVARGYQLEVPLPENLSGVDDPNAQLLVTAQLSLGRDRKFKTTQLIRMPSPDSEQQ